MSIAGREGTAQLLSSLNPDVKVVSEMLGHSTVKMTLDTYGHAVPGLTEAAANRLGELLSGRVTSDVTRLTINDPLSSKIS